MTERESLRRRLRMTRQPAGRYPLQLLDGGRADVRTSASSTSAYPGSGTPAVEPDRSMLPLPAVAAAARRGRAVSARTMGGRLPSILTTE